MTITVFEKNACVACTQTKKTLDRAGISYEKTNIMEDETAYDYITKELGHMAAPVVVVKDDDGKIINHWSGFQLEQINALSGN